MKATMGQERAGFGIQDHSAVFIPHDDDDDGDWSAGRNIYFAGSAHPYLMERGIGKKSIFPVHA